MQTLFYPFIPFKDVMAELKTTLSSRWIGQGKKVDEFELKFGGKYGYKYPLFMNSCTSSLELAYHLIDLKKGDEVIVPVLDCTAGQMGLKRRGVKIVFADILDNFNIDPDDVARKITQNTKAIVAVMLGGIPVDERLYKMAKRMKIPVITDAAQHLGHTQGDYICYSFQAIKHITTGDGGMLIVSGKREYDRAKKLRWFGIDRELKAKKNWQAWERRQMTFDITEAGYKYQPTDIDASLGLAGLKHADAILKHREKIALEYKKYLYGVEGLKLISGGSHWLFGILTDRRDEIAAALKKADIETNLVHLRNDIFELFGGKRLDLPNMNRLEDKYLYLPLHHLINQKDVQKTCRIILGVLGSKS
jgi:dTDP-4-amino-4,6-dideoxygalactose transaminase